MIEQKQHQCKLIIYYIICSLEIQFQNTDFDILFEVHYDIAVTYLASFLQWNNQGYRAKVTFECLLHFSEKFMVFQLIFCWKIKTCTVFKKVNFIRTNVILSVILFIPKRWCPPWKIPWKLLAFLHIIYTVFISFSF